MASRRPRAASGSATGAPPVSVVLPQVIRIVMPGMINTCVSIIKETTVVLIIGLIEFLAVLQIAFADPEWLIGDQVRSTGYLFAALVFLVLVLRPLALQRAARPADAGRFSPLSFVWSKRSFAISYPA